MRQWFPLHIKANQDVWTNPERCSFASKMTSTFWAKTIGSSIWTRKLYLQNDQSKASSISSPMANTTVVRVWSPMLAISNSDRGWKPFRIGFARWPTVSEWLMTWASWGVNSSCSTNLFSDGKAHMWSLRYAKIFWSFIFSIMVCFIVFGCGYIAKWSKN